MKPIPFLRHGLLALSLGLAALPTWADDDCDAPLNRWQTREAVRQMAAAQGWQIQRLKIDDGCYEIRGTDAQGRSFRAKIDPETLKVLKMKQDKHLRARERDRGEDGAARQTRPPQPDGVAVPSPLLTPGTAPRDQIE
ncbi:MAG: PepSY domain-containing protein [Thiobacillus sp.]|nr:PepSY domain-containing protein [Hydrogenophaga sp.]MBW8466771.1 PepSY domain-containing protein [Thiobacillus sp.]MDP2021425.1 PepSY domain-containing protein [Hydrogenophaga sp.]